MPPPPPSQPLLISEHVNFGTAILNQLIADITYQCHQDEALNKQSSVITMQIQTNLFLDVMLLNIKLC